MRAFFGAGPRRVVEHAKSIGMRRISRPEGEAVCAVFERHPMQAQQVHEDCIDRSGGL